MTKGLGGIEPNTPDTPKRGRGIFTARYRGRCGVCQDDIEAGDDCHYVDDEVCHLECE